MWFRNPERRQMMKQFSLIMFAGGPLEQSVGDGLVSDGMCYVDYTHRSHLLN
jgi:hypothetical protein